MLDRRLVEHIDWVFIFLTLTIFFIGLLSLLSATYETGTGFWRSIASPSSFVANQALWFGLGLVCMVIMMVFDYRLLERLAYPIFGFFFLLLVLVLLIGPVISGSQRWLTIGGFGFQPSEPAKLALIIILAKYFDENRRPHGFLLRELIIPIFLLLALLVPIYLEPDLGTCGIYILIWLSVVIFVGIRGRSFAFLSISVILASLFTYFFLLHDYQRDRIRVFLNPDLDPLGKGYHTIQSLIAIGSGGIAGKGFLKGTQTQLHFIPEQHTDFIFSVLGEEWGFIGCIILLLLLGAFLLWGLRIANHAKEMFGTLLAFGIVSVFFLHIIINIGGVLGLLPVTGVTLPFISYGGSSILTAFAGVGILMNISMRKYMF